MSFERRLRAQGLRLHWLKLQISRVRNPKCLEDCDRVSLHGPWRRLLRLHKGGRYQTEADMAEAYEQIRG